MCAQGRKALATRELAFKRINVRGRFSLFYEVEREAGRSAGERSAENPSVSR
jgi:hypothetical protein